MPSEYHGHVLLSACVGSSTLAARIEQLLFVFCGPKTGARFWTPKWGHNIKISSSASKFVALILGPWYICVLPSAKNALSCNRLHLSFMFLALGAKMLVSQYLVQFGSVPVSGACKTFCFFVISFRWLNQERCLASCSLSMVITVVTAYI